MGQFHEFEMTSITGDQISFDRYDGKVALVVNVASE
jgi:glutathione peroxidase-family protein